MGRVVWTLVLASLSVLGCGSSATDAGAKGSACGFSGAIPGRPETPALDSSLEAYVEGQARLMLEGYVGVYLRGETTVYRGTFGANDNQGVLGPEGGTDGFKNQRFPVEAAVAALSVDSRSSSLAVHGIAAKQYVVFEQEGGSSTTSVSILLPDSSVGGNTGVCERCVAPFATRPSSIAFSNITSSQTVNLGATGTANDDVTLHTTATAALERIAPCGVTFEDLEELNGASGLLFSAQDGDWVVDLTGQTPDPSDGSLVTYSLELYVNMDNLADYGVRNYSATKAPGP
jgi:hypothetical protein